MALTQVMYPTALVHSWLRGLLTVARADGDFTIQEQESIKTLTQGALGTTADLTNLAVITPEELAQALGQDPRTTEDFLRTAILVAVADGLYTAAEDALLYRFCTALGQNSTMLETLRSTLATDTQFEVPVATNLFPTARATFLQPLRDWLEGLEVRDTRMARFLCRMIPAQCPFERDIQFFSYKVHIPPMCKINPLYDELVGIRFRALNLLAEQGIDVMPYC
ncbi:Mo-dependent nitrogenase C-terminal domain-containing protein [Candidatus Cyanaurora vandensis]|uniref:Mo-dependent nitrogenase C-terminal domain-containing protein n=1 Tax=Candidatus Cyanaurora vandensis TaxID=2714958 RepID=UPI00258041E7|nr:Mo-dependent nitrogenase C-terminal domain-containing protein [Candidatus Cyanaurora vandensis]